MRLKLADGYVPTSFTEVIADGGAQSVASGAWPSANRAIYIPVIFPFPCQVYSIAFAATNGTGNYDLGFIDGYTKGKIASSGSTAMTAAGAKTLTFTTDIRVDPGKVYYAALALSSASGTVTRSNSGLPSMISLGMGQEAAALPLPSTITPVTVASAYMPLIAFGVR
jgi:hypothetical protein